MSPSPAHVFPPALLPLLRERLGAHPTCVREVDDAALAELLTTVFFAGLETNEHERNPIRVVFVGHHPFDLALSQREGPHAPPSYRWRSLRFETARPFSVRELVKLSVARGDEQLYTQVQCGDDGLVISGLSREGDNLEDDSFLKVVASRAGGLSLSCGPHWILEYERGSVLPVSESVELFSEPIRSALQRSAADAGLRGDVAADYLATVQTLVGEMAAHGHGGILIVSSEEEPKLPESSPYRITRDSSLTSLLRMIRHLAERRPAPTAESPPSSNGAPGVHFSQLLRTAFLREAERTIRDFGALTAIDGATILNRALALFGFGVVLPMAGARRILASVQAGDGTPRSLDFTSRGTRHAAGALYASEHPASVVFVASEDDLVTCMLRAPGHDHVATWRLGSGPKQASRIFGPTTVV